MKFLQNQGLIKLTQELTDATVHGSIGINGRIEAFSCKRAGNDKKHANSLAERIETEIELSAAEQNKLKKHHAGGSDAMETLSSSPLGDLTTVWPRKLMTDLMLTLNLSFPDYDFTSLKADDFLRVSSPYVAIEKVNERLAEFAFTEKGPGFLSEMWKAIDKVIFVDDCVVFSYVPPDGTDFLKDTLTEGSINNCSDDALWSFNYFFVNRSLKRIVAFTCVESYLVSNDDGGLSDEDNVTFDMDYDW